MLFDGFFVKRQSLPFLNRNGVLRTLGKTSAQPVAIAFAYELGLAVNYLQSAFGAGVYAQPAAVAFVFVYFNDFPFHIFSPCFFGIYGIIIQNPERFVCICGYILSKKGIFYAGRTY
jgi:hypothetical protein